MNSISPNAINPSASFPGLSGLSGASDLSSLANLSRFAFGGLDVESLASAIVDAAKSGTLSEELLDLLSKFLSPVEMGQLLAAIEKLISGDMGTGGAPAPAPNAADGGTGGETSSGNRTGGMTSGNAPVAATAPTVASGAPTSPVAAPAAGSDTRITTRAPDSANIPALETMASNPVVAAAIDKAWINSNPNGPGAKQEQGFWVLRDDKTGEYSIVNFPSNGTRDSLTPGAVPKVEGKSVAAFFHTHPNTAAEGYRNGPSDADQKFADAKGIPGIIQSHVGLYFFNPAK
jgi:hypothetical protein